MKTLTLTILLLSINVCMACEKEVTLTFADAEEGKVRVFTISKDKFNNLPEWKPGEKEAPISINQAFIRAKNKFLETGELGGKSYRPTDIQLLLKPENDKGHWFYMVLFVEHPSPKPAPGQHQVFSKSRQIVVLLDGTVLAGEVISEKEFYSRIRPGKC